ncbi:MAG: HAMP domain-containing protein, partial [Candidatus Margulisiibacteriota bacterium]
MFTTLTIVSIFTEIFASGILLSGIYAFFRKFVTEKNYKDLALSLLFLAFSIFTILTIVSQIFYNLDRSLSDLILIQKLISISLLAGSFLLAVLIRTKLGWKINWLIALFALPVCYLMFLTLATPDSQITLNYRPDILEPLVTFGNLPALYKPLFFMMWGLIGLFVLVFEKRGKRALSYLFSFSCLFFVISYVLTIFYINQGESLYLLFSWVSTLFGILGINLAELIPADSPYAGSPLSFLRSRLLFKLLFIFVLLIIILFEITTLVTLTLSKQALNTAIINNYKEIAQSTASKINDFPKLDPQIVLKLVMQKTEGTRTVFVVDKNGYIIAHSDVPRIRENVSGREPIASALSGKSGGGKFPPDEFGEVNAGAYAPIKKFGGAVIVEEPLRQAYSELRLLETNSLLFAIAGILLTVLTGIFFAQSIERSIHRLIAGTEAISKGDLNTRISIDSIDELGSLASAFNKMTKDLKDSQERLILSEKLASLGTMAAGMAHEIKNP